MTPSIDRQAESDEITLIGEVRMGEATEMCSLAETKGTGMAGREGAV